LQAADGMSQRPGMFGVKGSGQPSQDRILVTREENREAIRADFDPYAPRSTPFLEIFPLFGMGEYPMDRILESGGFMIQFCSNAPPTTRKTTMLYSTPVFHDPAQSILIVDDDDMITELLSAGFTQFGFKVYIADNGLDAWNLFNRESIGIVLTDIRMPGMDGPELCRRIRNHSPSAILAVMTGGDPDCAADLLNAGSADYFFSKPFDIIQICEILQAETQAT